MARSWVIELSPFELLLTSNQRLHYYVRAARVKQLRKIGCGLSKAQKIPHLDKIQAYGYIIVPDRRRRDANNWWPTWKAMLDGVVDAGVLDDDNSEYVTGPDMRLIYPGEPGWRKVYRKHLLLSLRIVEIEEAPDGCEDEGHPS